MQPLVFLLIYLSVLILPGLALQKAVGSLRPQFVLSIAYSYTAFTLIFVCANYFGLSPTVLKSVLAAELLASVCVFTLYKSPSLKRVLDKPSLIIIAASLLYQFLVGAFMEVPADIYAHLERYQAALLAIESQNLGNSLAWKQLFLQKSGVFYYLVALTNSLVGISTNQLVEVIDFANRTLVLLATYHFSKTIFNQRSQRDLIALVATMFVAVHFGTSVFAYIRYYTIAPTMLNMVLYMAAIVVFLNAITLSSARKIALRYVGISLLIMAAAAIHVQESLFIVILISAICLIATLSKFTSHPIPNLRFRQTSIIVALALIAFIGIFVYSNLNLNRAANAHWRLWDFGPSFGGIFPQLTILNLGKEFIQVLTLWGVFVYFLFFLNIKRYRENVFVLAAMASPALTILNPFFVDLFLRHYNSTTLWRFCFLIPVHLVAADLFIYYWQQLRHGSLVKQSFAVPIMLLLIGLLLPIENTWNNIHYSRFPTLLRSEPSLTHENYRGLINYLNSLDQRQQIITDPMTGYMLSAMTKHHSERKKFSRNYRFKNFTFESYDDQPLSKYSGHLLITNQRKHSVSEIGRLSGHWRRYPWNNKPHYYTDTLLDYIKDNPERFINTWSDKGVTVYLIK